MSIRVSSKVSASALRVQEPSPRGVQVLGKASLAAAPKAQQARSPVDVFDSSARRLSSRGDAFEPARPHSHTRDAHKQDHSPKSSAHIRNFLKHSSCSDTADLSSQKHGDETPPVGNGGLILIKVPPGDSKYGGHNKK